ncbi:MAG: hypothetical protein H0U71_00690 [Gammaproteobacteria bacterium]|nr:hypothetical protein [Gammaproteobacteria bacterium]
MTAFKRILLIALLLLTLVYIGYQLYLIFSPLRIARNETKYFHLVDEYQVLRMQRLVLQEKYALGHLKNINSVQSRKTLLPNATLALHQGVIYHQPIALSLEQAKTFEQLEAYVSNNKPLRPQSLTNDEKFLLNAPSDNFTLQLMGVREPEELTRFIRDNKVQEAKIFHTYYLDKDWYVLVCGLYKNHTEALQMMDNLPETIRTQKPWIRQISNIKKAIQIYR